MKIRRGCLDQLGIGLTPDLNYSKGVGYGRPTHHCARREIGSLHHIPSEESQGYAARRVRPSGLFLEPCARLSLKLPRVEAEIEQAPPDLGAADPPRELGTEPSPPGSTNGAQLGKDVARVRS